MASKLLIAFLLGAISMTVVSAQNFDFFYFVQQVFWHLLIISCHRQPSNLPCKWFPCTSREKQRKNAWLFYVQEFPSCFQPERIAVSERICVLGLGCSGQVHIATRTVDAASPWLGLQEHSSASTVCGPTTMMVVIPASAAVIPLIPTWYTSPISWSLFTEIVCC